ncbi:dTDP-4-dehydrorhamnose reductase [Leptolyngbya sp. AN03gr2]|uniref:dTDP-4-dehydrorhamnose reductase n=1 Tax=unclassified Leptolyngbya TaxID=2650499 RepID=UPI003D31734B
MVKILLIGATGQVGWELQRTLSTLAELVCVSHASKGYRSMNLTKSDRIREVIREVQPTLIVNAAAYTAVDKAETEPELAMTVNGKALQIIAEEAKRLNAGVIHYSTDYVFDGTQTAPYGEAARPNPLNVYGKTKLAGEQALATIEVPYLIFRTSWVYGLRGKNFLRTMLKLAQERQELKIVADQIGAPTWSRTIAEVTAQIVAQAKPDPTRFLNDYQGIYHLTSTGQASWYEFAKTIFELTKSFEQQAIKAVLPISSEEYPTPAKRPLYSSLDLTKISQTFNLQLPNWHQALELVLSEWNDR